MHIQAHACVLSACFLHMLILHIMSIQRCVFTSKPKEQLHYYTVWINFGCWQAWRHTDYSSALLAYFKSQLLWILIIFCDYVAIRNANHLFPWHYVQVKSAIAPVMVVAGDPKRNSVKAVSTPLLLAEHDLLLASFQLFCWCIFWYGHRCFINTLFTFM